jgi:hypothetical protein
MNIGEIVGSKVMVLLQSARGVAKLGIDETRAYCRVVDFDHIGLWVENPHYEETLIRDESGDLIPRSERRAQRYVGPVVIPRGNVRSIVAFPGREKDAELGREEARPIGSTGSSSAFRSTPSGPPWFPRRGEAVQPELGCLLGLGCDRGSNRKRPSLLSRRQLVLAARCDPLSFFTGGWHARRFAGGGDAAPVRARRGAGALRGGGSVLAPDAS